MKKLTLTFFILSSLICISAFSQNEYFVKNEGDTVFCKIKEINSVGDMDHRPANNLVYKLPSGDKRFIYFKYIKGYKKKGQVFLIKKITIDTTTGANSYIDTLYFFFPREIGRYKYSADVIQRNSSWFYKNAVSSGGGNVYWSNGNMYTAGGGSSLDFYVGKEGSLVLKRLPVAINMFKSNPVNTWKILEAYCLDDSDVMEGLKRYQRENVRCNQKNLQEAIESYVGMKFDSAPKAPKVDEEKYE